MPSRPPTDLTTLLARLAAGGVEFVLVGGLAAVTQGAPITTHDVDIVPARTQENITRLLAILTSVNARYRGRPAGQILAPTAATLIGPGHSLLMTDLGPLDVLGAIEGGLGYDELIRESLAVHIEGHLVHVLKLAALVELKRKSTHPKDRLALPVLEETLRRSAKAGEPDES